MRFGRNSVRAAFVSALALVSGVVACREKSSAPPPAPAAAPAPPASSSSAPHGDHNPHHGGVVLMKGDLHYEAVFDPTGKAYRVFFTDAVRDDLPASVARDVTLTIRRKNQPDEPIVMQIDDTGESWIGSGRVVEQPAATTVRVAFSLQQEPYFIDVPFGGPPSGP